MKIRTSIFCFFLIFACAGILLGRLDSEHTGTALNTGGSEGGMTPGAVKAVEPAGGISAGTQDESGPRCTIVVDAGHGGRDAGKVGVNGVLEKTVNLEIARLLGQHLESQNIQVVMTRTGDEGLYSENASNKKAEDMKKRVELVQDSGALLLVSIHQNSYTKSDGHGAQVFYYTGSEEGEKLAKAVQARLIAEADPTNHRTAMASSEYYLLKKSPVPAIICECGFLSNPKECEKLCTPEYQKLIAGSIFQGIMDYLDNSGL